MKLLLILDGSKTIKKKMRNKRVFFNFFKQNYSFLIIYQIAIDFFEKRKKMKKSVL